MSPPEMIFVLASPRSGSTLLRVMLAGHTELFSPPELNLLPFYTMAERDSKLGAMANCVSDCDQRFGLVEAVMNLTGSDADQSEVWLRPYIERNAPVEMMYRLLRDMVAPRRLVDKATINASSVETLARSVLVSPQAPYIHLVRHPLPRSSLCSGPTCNTSPRTKPYILQKRYGRSLTTISYASLTNSIRGGTRESSSRSWCGIRKW